MLGSLKLRDFRCFSGVECEFVPGTNVIVGPNAQGKTSLLEAACVLLRLQSLRAATLGPLIRVGGLGFVVDGFYAGTHLQFYYSPRRKKLAMDSVEQKNAAEYLKVGRVVCFANGDIALIRGGAEERRRYLDFVAVQMEPAYRQHLKAYERALRSRNYLLKAASVRWREVAAFDEPLIEAGSALTAMRTALVEALMPHAIAAHRGISSGAAETLTLDYAPAASAESGVFRAMLAESREADQRLRVTQVGPHRDDLLMGIGGLGSELASEGQQRTMAIALRLAHAGLVRERFETPPLLLLDDVFGELDVARRNALLGYLPAEAQKIITTTHLDWAEMPLERVFHLQDKALKIR